MGRFDDSLDQIRKARDLDPLSTNINWSLGWRLYLARQYDRSIAQLRDALEMDPSYEWAHLILGEAYEQKANSTWRLLNCERPPNFLTIVH